MFLNLKNKRENPFDKSHGRFGKLTSNPYKGDATSRFPKKPAAQIPTPIESISLKSTTLEAAEKAPTTKVEKKPVVDVLEPGLVLLRNFVSDSECKKLAGIAEQWGDGGESGFYSSEGGEKKLNTGEKGRGRIYDAATRFPRHVLEHCDSAVETARKADTEMPNMTCTHLLLNMYTTSAGLVWHRDIYENDGSSDHPVVNLCIGASCKFGLKHNDDDPDKVITLRSGDILLFGGPCRLIKHAVLEVLLDDCPSWMKESPKRFSFTFRDSPEVLGREEEFKYFKVKEHLVGQDDFKVPTNSKEFKGLPSMTTQRKSAVQSEE